MGKRNEIRTQGRQYGKVSAVKKEATVRLTELQVEEERLENELDRSEYMNPAQRDEIRERLACITKEKLKLKEGLDQWEKLQASRSQARS